jgi:hypothetical protein
MVSPAFLRLALRTGRLYMTLIEYIVVYLLVYRYHDGGA